MAPKVLVSDKLSETAVQIFRDRGIDVTFEPGLGKDKDRLLEVIGEYDGSGDPLGHESHRQAAGGRDQSEGRGPGRDRRRQCRDSRRVEERA